MILSSRNTAADPPIVLVLLDGLGDYTTYKATDLLSDSPQSEGSVHGRDVSPSVTAPSSCVFSKASYYSPLSLVASQQEVVSSSIPFLTGLMDPVRSGLACGSDTAHLSILGYPPAKYYRGRGSFEALGAGMNMLAGDIAFKCNFATMSMTVREVKEQCNTFSADLSSTNNNSRDTSSLYFTPPEQTDTSYSDALPSFTGETPLVVSRRADRNFDREGPILCECLNGLVIDRNIDGRPFSLPSCCPTGSVSLVDSKTDGMPLVYTVYVKYATEHRCGVVIRGPHLSDRITGTDPLVNGKKLLWCRPSFSLSSPTDSVHCEEYARAVLTSDVIMAATKAMTHILCQHPINAVERVRSGKPMANVVLFRGAAHLSHGTPTFAEMHSLKGFAVAPTCIIRGLCKSIGLDIYDSVGGTGGLDTNVMGKAEKVLEVLKRGREGPLGDVTQSDNTASNDSDSHKDTPYNFAFLHVKGVDDAGHEKSPAEKVRLLDQSFRMIKHLWKLLPVGSTVAITGDHSTPCVLGDHSSEPVPFGVMKKPPDFPALNSTKIEQVAASIPGIVNSGVCESHDDNDNDKHHLPGNSNVSVLQSKAAFLSMVRRAKKLRFTNSPSSDNNNLITSNIISQGMFSEYHCEVNGALGRFRGDQMMSIIKEVHYGAACERPCSV